MNDMVETNIAEMSEEQIIQSLMGSDTQDGEVADDARGNAPGDETERQEVETQAQGEDEQTKIDKAIGQRLYAERQRLKREFESSPEYIAAQKAKAVFGASDANDLMRRFDEMEIRRQAALLKNNPEAYVRQMQYQAQAPQQEDPTAVYDIALEQALDMGETKEGFINLLDHNLDFRNAIESGLPLHLAYKYIPTGIQVQEQEAEQQARRPAPIKQMASNSISPPNIAKMSLEDAEKLAARYFTVGI